VPLGSASSRLQVTPAPAYQVTLVATASRNCGHVQRTRVKCAESVSRREKHFIAVVMRGGKVSCFQNRSS
jgi:hypothetical protein